jgi:hypothetical protein
VEGTQVAGSLWALALGYLSARRHRSAPAKAAPTSRPNKRPPDRSADSGLGHRLASEPQVLERMVSVRPNSLALVLTADRPPQPKLTGELLRPNMVPQLRPVRVVVVNTAVTHLDVTVKDLVSLDGYPLDHVKIRLAVQLSDADQYSTLIGLVTDHAADLDSHLLQLVQQEVTASLQGAVRMNRLADLDRETLQRVLEDRWLPRGLGGGALVRRGFTVLESVSPQAADRSLPAGPGQVRPSGAPPEQPSPFSRPARTPALALVPRPRLNLTMDARLRRVWRDHADQELLGIAGAKEIDGATVIAVPSRHPGAYESSRLEEAFKQYYADGRVRVVSAVAESYDDVVRAWFSQVDSSRGRLISIQSTDDDAALRIRVGRDQLVRGGAEDDVSVGRHADREALRALLPHERVEFVPAETSG